jgi:hypothetical protein
MRQVCRSSILAKNGVRPSGQTAYFIPRRGIAPPRKKEKPAARAGNVGKLGTPEWEYEIGNTNHVAQTGSPD